MSKAAAQQPSADLMATVREIYAERQRSTRYCGKRWFCGGCAAEIKTLPGAMICHNCCPEEFARWTTQ